MDLRRAWLLILLLPWWKVQGQDIANRKALQIGFAISKGYESNTTGLPVIHFKNSIYLRSEKTISIIPNLSYFHGVAAWQQSVADEQKGSYSAINTGIDFALNFRLDKKRIYITPLAGLGISLYNATTVAGGFQGYDRFGREIFLYRYETLEEILPSYHLGMEMGGFISKRISLGLNWDFVTYSFFADLLTIGIHTRVKI